MFGQEAQGLAQRVKVWSEEWQINFHDRWCQHCRTFASAPNFSLAQEKQWIGLSLEGLSRGKNNLTASSEASRFLNVPFLASICSVIWVQKPHVSFSHTRSAPCCTSHTNWHTSHCMTNQGKSWIQNWQCWWRQDWNAHPCCSFRRPSKQNPCYTIWKHGQNVFAFRNCNRPHVPCCLVNAA